MMMNKRIGKVLFVLLALVGCFTALAGRSVMAQQDTGAQGEQKVAKKGFSGTSGQGEPVRVVLERGGKVAVDNRTTGRIVIIGWDKDTVEARATSERGVEIVRFSTEYQTSSATRRDD
jgi:hypothetical protein